MKANKLYATLLLLISIFITSCGSDTPSQAEIDQLEDAGRSRLATISGIESQMAGNGLVMKYSGIDRMNIEYTGSNTLSTDQRVIGLMRTYVREVNSFLSDYSSGDWWVSNRSTLETKRNLVRNLLPDVQSMITTKAERQELRRAEERERQRKIAKFNEKTSEFMVEQKKAEEILLKAKIQFSKKSTRLDSGENFDYAQADFETQFYLDRSIANKDFSLIRNRLNEIEQAMMAFVILMKDDIDKMREFLAERDFEATQTQLRYFFYHYSKFDAIKSVLDDFEDLKKRVDEIEANLE